MELKGLSVKVHACVGGTSVREDQRILSSGVHVVVGTPGRVFDMLRRQSLRPVYIKMFVLDEADEMLSRGIRNGLGIGIHLVDEIVFDDHMFVNDLDCNMLAIFCVCGQFNLGESTFSDCSTEKLCSSSLLLDPL
ncbi:unnamed protein product [Camellia sinensis]